jgi:AcrR family transcriptional regulator
MPFVKTQSKVRREGADATRRRIVDAAQRLFLEQGYASTTIQQVADAAGVAVQTVYWAFGNKAALVVGIRERWLAQAHTAERLQTVLAVQDPHERLAAAAAFMRHQWETGAGAVAVQQDAMRADPQIRGDVQAVLANRARVLAPIIAPLRTSLRRDIQPGEAVDVFIALLGFEIYQELRNRRWSAARYERWLARTLQESLLPRPHHVAD